MSIETIKERIKKIKDSSQAQHRSIVESFKAIVEYLEEKEKIYSRINNEIVFRSTAPMPSMPDDIILPTPITPSIEEAIKKYKEKTIEHNTRSGSKQD